MSRDAPDVVVVGAGAAGILAAWRAASLGAKVVLLEKNDKIGIKILISGGGKCNITHDGPMQHLLHAFRPNEAQFLKSSCYRFKNTDIVAMLEAKGLEVYTRPDGRIFPVDGTAKDVVRILGEYLDEVGVEVRLESPVAEIRSVDGRVTGVSSATGIVECGRVVLSVGGMSYPKTGTTGDGYPWLRSLGHTVTKIRPALAPIHLSVDPSWSGVALRDCVLKARQGKEVARWRGDLLFTHTGVSGPTVLGVSRVVAERLVDGPVTLEVDVTPALPHEALTAAILKYAADHPRRSIGSLAATWVPDRLVDAVFDSAGFDPSLVAGQVPVKARNRLIEVLKGWVLGEVRAVPIDRSEVVAGGVALDEVDPFTMRSLRCSGLYLCGEILDIAGPVGGYNLQAAFATGWVAGEHARREALGVGR